MAIEAQAAAQRGGGNTETTQVATAVVTKGIGIVDQVATVVAPSRGTTTKLVDTALILDRTVATPYGK
jgi:hypothetical protein